MTLSTPRTCASVRIAELRRARAARRSRRVCSRLLRFEAVAGERGSVIVIARTKTMMRATFVTLGTATIPPPLLDANRVASADQPNHSALVTKTLYREQRASRLRRADLRRSSCYTFRT